MGPRTLHSGKCWKTLVSSPIFPVLLASIHIIDAYICMSGYQILNNYDCTQRNPAQNAKSRLINENLVN